MFCCTLCAVTTTGCNVTASCAGAPTGMRHIVTPHNETRTCHAFPDSIRCVAGGLHGTACKLWPPIVVDSFITAPIGREEIANPVAAVRTRQVDTAKDAVRYVDFQRY